MQITLQNDTAMATTRGQAWILAERFRHAHSLVPSTAKSLVRCRYPAICADMCNEKIVIAPNTKEHLINYQAFLIAMCAWIGNQVEVIHTIWLAHLLTYFQKKPVPKTARQA